MTMTMMMPQSGGGGGGEIVTLPLGQMMDQAEAILKRNLEVIHQCSANQQSRHLDRLAENHRLLRELDANLSRIVALYSDFGVHLPRA